MKRACVSAPTLALAMDKMDLNGGSASLCKHESAICVCSTAISVVGFSYHSK